jgi:GT2 family glycosyltransferase
MTRVASRNRGAREPGGAISAHVFVVVPVHNRVGFTRECLGALTGQTYSDLSVIVVDDGSADGTAEAVRHYYPDVVLLEGDGSLWWAGATNMGVAWALERCSGGDYVLTLNNDTVVLPDYVSSLVAVSRSCAPALVGSVAVDVRDGDTIADGGPAVNWASAKWRRLNEGRSLRECRQEGFTVTRPDVLSGRGTLIPVECIRRVGLFNARRLPHYGADYEFSRRAARAGYQLVMSYASAVASHVDATGPSTRRGRLAWRLFASTYFTRRSPSCLLYRWRFARLAAPRGALALFILLDTVRVVVGGLRDQVARGGAPRDRNR